MDRSIIYRNIWIYRFVMQILYAGKANDRFRRIVRHIHVGENFVVELCFGDIFIAKYCQKNEKKWTGYDISPDFVSLAKKSGFNAEVADLMKGTLLPQSDLVIMAGSLYHFGEWLEPLFKLILQSTNRVLISEAISNLSSNPGVLGCVSRALTNAGKGHESFRFTEETLVEALKNLAPKLGFEYQIVDKTGREVIVEIKKLK